MINAAVFSTNGKAQDPSGKFRDPRSKNLDGEVRKGNKQDKHAKHRNPTRPCKQCGEMHMDFSRPKLILAAPVTPPAHLPRTYTNFTRGTLDTRGAVLALYHASSYPRAFGPQFIGTTNPILIFSKMSASLLHAGHHRYPSKYRVSTQAISHFESPVNFDAM